MEKKNRLSLAETRFYMGELVQAIDAIHQCGFIHRDSILQTIFSGEDSRVSVLGNNRYTRTYFTDTNFHFVRMT